MAENWTDEELAAAIDAYQEMAEQEAARKPYSKREYFRDLAARFERTEKSFEYRMQNISAVLNELGKPWIPGLKPAGNVGTHVKDRIITLLEESASGRKGKNVPAASYKTNLPAMREWLIRVAQANERVTYEEMMQVFDIDRFSLRYAMDYLGHQAENLDEPILTALIVGKRSRRCSDGFAKEFGITDDSAERESLYKFWEKKPIESAPPSAIPDDGKTKALRFAVVASRPDQAVFRRKVFEQYNGKCVISGCDVDKALDAAHKHGRDWRQGHNEGTDGYLLRKDLHALYDNGLLKISDDGVVELDPDILGHYEEFSEKKLPHRF